MYAGSDTSQNDSVGCYLPIFETRVLRYKEAKKKRKKASLFAVTWASPREFSWHIVGSVYERKQAKGSYLEAVENMANMAKRGHLYIRKKRQKIRKRALQIGFSNCLSLFLCWRKSFRFAWSYKTCNFIRLRMLTKSLWTKGKMPSRTAALETRDLD